MDAEPIDWSAVRACYGPATSVPVWLSALASPEQAERNDAIAELWGNLCHQGTVYEASAVAAPLLFRAARSLELPAADRAQLLALVVHIGLGDDTTWRDYTPWQVVENCYRVTDALLPEFAAWALQGPPEARTWTLALAAFHTDTWAALRLDPEPLMPAALPAIKALVRSALSGAAPEDDVVEHMLSNDDDLRDYYDEVLAELPDQKRARGLILELAITERL